MREDQECVRRLRGDGLSVKMDSNYRILEVTGDGCKITLTKNCGSVRVVGDGCRVKVTHNVGDIVYTGDGGRVLLGPKSSKEKVKYFGDGGKISFDSESKRSSSNPRKEEKVEITPKASTILKNCLGTDTEKKRKKYDELSPEVKNNLRNERKEKTDRKKDEKDTRNARKATVFVTTRMTTSNEPRDLFGVEKWFVAPSTVVRSFVNDVPTVTVREKKSTTTSRN
ncbi:hypothetical protein KPH14_009483 [Odynerus spinipes]|uniref:Uncharacterized protein n=1 Tax=Odynerus spinipes TaxID=1348599 RepID=A0AAD9RPJ0_9HYME|nr:hypothetical protein KPH14_009483 [Odynerus spinipes]